MTTNENICTITNLAGDIFVIRKDDVTCVMKTKNHTTIIFTVGGPISMGTLKEDIDTLTTYLMDE